MGKSRGADTACDQGAGEEYYAQSSGVQASLDLCKKSCQDVAACKAITYYSSGWCSHYSTDCSNTKAEGGAVAMQKISGGAIRTWKLVGSKTTCDRRASEKYY